MNSHIIKNLTILLLLCVSIYLYLSPRSNRPFFDVFATDLFESRIIKYYESDLIATRVLFIDYLSEENAKLSSYARDRLLRLIDFNNKGNFERFLGFLSENVSEISKDNTVFYDVNGKVILCVIGGSKSVDTNYRGVLAKDKTSSLINGFKSHLITLKNSLKGDSDRKANWGQYNGKQ